MTGKNYIRGMYRSYIAPGAVLLLLFLALAGTGCRREDPYEWKEMEVMVTAYNSVAWQTEGDPALAAWGDTLYPGMKAVAVSRDLIALGLDHETPVLIEGLPDTFRVKDKMNARFKSHIDIYMGDDVRKAREWGRRRLKIRYGVPKTRPTDSTSALEK